MVVTGGKTEDHSLGVSGQEGNLHVMVNSHPARMLYHMLLYPNKTRFKTYILYRIQTSTYICYNKHIGHITQNQHTLATCSVYLI